MEMDSKCALSIVITVVGGERALRKCLDALAPQVTDRPFEIIVPYDSNIEEIGLLAETYPNVCFLNVGKFTLAAKPGSLAADHEIYDKLKARGLAAARGQIMALLDDGGYPAPDWCQQILDAHQLPYGVIGGAVEQAAKDVLNWAVYFPDFGRYQLPLSEGPSSYLTDINVSYKRETLSSVREIWAERYNEVAVHWALSKQGVVLWRRPQMVVNLDRGDLRLPSLIRQRYAWGRLFGSIRSNSVSPISKLIYILSSPGIPFILIGRMGTKIFRDRRNRAQFLRALPFTFLLTWMWSFGEVVGTITGRDS